MILRLIYVYEIVFDVYYIICLFYFNAISNMWHYDCLYYDAQKMQTEYLYEC